MKFRNIIAALLAVLLLFSLSACGSEKPLTGKYVIVSVKDDPGGLTFKDLKAMYKDTERDVTDYLYFEFMAGNRFTLVMFGDQEASGTYTRSGNTLTMTAGEWTTTATVSGNKISWKYETGAKLTFQNSDAPGGIGDWIWIICGALVVIAIGGGVVFIFIKKKKNITVTSKKERKK